MACHVNEGVAIFCTDSADNNGLEAPALLTLTLTAGHRFRQLSINLRDRYSDFRGNEQRIRLWDDDVSKLQEVCHSCYSCTVLCTADAELLIHSHTWANFSEGLHRMHRATRFWNSSHLPTNGNVISSNLFHLANQISFSFMSPRHLPKDAVLNDWIKSESGASECNCAMGSFDNVWA